MTKLSGNLMRADRATAAPVEACPAADADDCRRGAQRLALTPTAKHPCPAIDAVFTRHERLWQESKQEAITALSAGFAEKMADA